MKMIGGLNWKKNKKRNATLVQEQLIPTKADDGIDETDYMTLKPGNHSVSLQPEQKINQSTDTAMEVIQDGLADMVFSD